MKIAQSRHPNTYDICINFCLYGTMIKLKQMFDLRFTCIHGSAVREVGWWGGGGADRLTKNPDKLNKNHYISNHQNHIINILFFHIILYMFPKSVCVCLGGFYNFLYINFSLFPDPPPLKKKNATCLDRSKC